MVEVGFGCSCNDSTKIEPQYSISALERLKGTSDFDIIWKFAGWEEKGDECGKIIAVNSCIEHPELHKTITHRCFDPKCEFCYNTWIGRQIKQSEERFIACKILYNEQGHNIGGIKSVVVSPPQTDEIIEMTKTRNNFNKLSKICTDYLRRLGAKGGIVQFHLYRVNKKYKRKFAKYKKDGGDGGIWDWIRDNELWNVAICISPHFHTLIYGFLKPSGLAFEDFLNNKRTNRFNGWIYNHNEPDVEGGRDLKRTIAYTLNHCSLAYRNIYERRPIEVTRYFGIMAKNKLIKDKEKSTVEYIYPECEICEKPIHNFIDKERSAIFIPKVVEDNPENLFIFCNLHDLGEVKEKIVHTVYKINGGSWYYRWRPKKRKVKEDGKVIHDGMVKEYFTPK